jgi:hypothetical protein
MAVVKMASETTERDPEELSEQSYQWHRKRQLRELGVDPEEIDV